MTKKDYKNTTKVRRCTHSPEHPYTPISNYMLKDDKLNFTEKGFMAWLLSNNYDGDDNEKEKYIFNSKYVQEFISGIGQDRYYKMVDHLMELGYLGKTRTEGQTNWTINEILFKVSNTVSSSENTSIDFNNIGNTTIENTSIDFNSVDNTTIISTNKTNTNEPSKNLPNTNEPSKNYSVVDKQGQKKSLGFNETEEEKNNHDFDKTKIITPNDDFKELLPKDEPKSIIPMVEEVLNKNTSNPEPEKITPKVKKTILNEDDFFDGNHTKHFSPINFQNIYNFYSDEVYDRMGIHITYYQFEKIFLLNLGDNYLKADDNNISMNKLLFNNNIKMTKEEIRDYIQTLKDNSEVRNGMNKLIKYLIKTDQ